MILTRALFIITLLFCSTLKAKESPKLSQKELLNRDFIAILKKGTVIVNKETKQSLVVPSTIKVRAKQHKIGGQYSDIFTIKGENKYYTLTKNLSSLEEDQALAPKVDHLSVYDYSGEIIQYNKLFETLTFLDYQLSFISSEYYPEIYRGTSTTAVENQFGIKQYFSHPTIPIDFGIAGSIHRGFWNDDNGTVTWNAAFLGPTIHTTLWESDKGGLHLHISAMKSLYHKSTFDPDYHKFSTNMLRIELSQSFKMRYGSFTLGGAVNFMQSSIKETTEYLETIGEREDIIGIGFTLGFLRPWILNL